MVGIKGSIMDKFNALKEIGYDGVELNLPGTVDLKQVNAAIDATGLIVDGSVQKTHWDVRCSDPDASVRQQALEGLIGSIRETKAVGGHSVLLVPGKVTDPVKENHEQTWERSIAVIRQALPLAAELGVRILIENVWNNFLYDPKGGENQTAETFAKYLDEIDSPWVQAHFDIGNHQKFGRPAEWIRRLGNRRIAKLDVKDWGKKNDFCKIGDGDIDWPQVRHALAEIRYSGWAAAEVDGGEREALADVLARMKRVLLAA